MKFNQHFNCKWYLIYEYENIKTATIVLKHTFIEDKIGRPFSVTCACLFQSFLSLYIISENMGVGGKYRLSFI
jgi:hypothetical protein